MKYKAMAIAGVFVCFTTVGAAIASAQRYRITDLGKINPTGINAWAQVVGNYKGHAFLWTKWSGMTDLGLLPGGTFSMAASINDLGVVVGTADGIGVESYPDFDTQCSDLVQPFVWRQPTGMKGLGTRNWGSQGYYPCFIPEFATANNDHGQVVGYNGAFATFQFGFVWYNNNWTVLGPFGDPPDSGNAVSNTGQIVGQVGAVECTGCFPGHAASWTNGVSIDLGTLGGTDPNYTYGSSANGVNDLGQIVGWSGTAPDAFYGGIFHAVLWPKNGSILDLGTLPGDTLSTALKINFFGQAIGSSGNTAIYTLYDAFLTPCCSLGVSGRPFIWSERHGMQDLNTLIRANSGWVLNSVSDINVWGQIVGSGIYNGRAHGFLLTPQVFNVPKAQDLFSGPKTILER
jgi:probable HAF family extracellular repeat protein